MVVVVTFRWCADCQEAHEVYRSVIGQIVICPRVPRGEVWGTPTVIRREP